MKKNITKLFLFFVFIRAGVCWAGPQKEMMCEDFQTQKAEQFPQGFSTYPFQKHKATKVYSVQKEGGNLFLHAEDLPGMTAQIFKKFHWEKNTTPIFSWKWRAQDLPKNAAEDQPSLNDSACSVYVVYGGWLGKAIKYVWSSTLPSGQVIENIPDKFYTVILESGPKFLGQWRTESADVAKDYQNYFHKTPKDPSGFGLLTDGDQTQSSSICDYDDFTTSH